MRTTRGWTNVRIVIALFVIGIAVFPIYWMLVTSLTDDGRLFGRSPQLVPDLSQIGVYSDAFAGGVPRWILNSFLIAAGTCIVSIGLGIPLGYALSRFRFRGKAIVAAALFVTQMLPEALLVVPIFGLFRQLDLLNSLPGLVLVNAAFVLPVVALILKGAIDGVPRELEEAARVDGCRPLSVLVRINLPLVAPALAATAVIAFFHGWNEYVFAVTFIFEDALKPASVGLAGYIGELSTPMQTVMAVALMYTLPAIVFYLFTQRYVVAGITAGAVKG